MPNCQTASLAYVFERAFAAVQARVAAFGQSPAGEALGKDAGIRAFAVAYSGGLDSSALLHLACQYASRHAITLYAFHIHHGLSPDADAWLRHCEQECARLGIAFDAQRVHLAGDERGGVEQAARIKRYAALGELCRAYEVPLLLTAHHQDDQAETVLLQLLRGAGVAGLSGMEVASSAPELLGDPDLVIARPMLGMARAELEQYVTQQSIRYVDDASNADVRYARNALRHRVMPELAACFPGFQERIARSALHAQAGQRLLNELAAQDLALCRDGDRIDITCLERLDADRIDNLLRYWLASRGMRMPATAWLAEMRTQLLEAGVDAQVCVTHADCEIRRYRNRIYLTPRLDAAALAVPPLTFRWRGEARIDFPAYAGTLYFDVVEQGIDAAWLRANDLQICWRGAGQTLKLAPNRPSRSLKQHYQAMNIPAWERLRLPMVTAGDKLLFAAGIGMNWQHIAPDAALAVCMRWETNLL